MRHTARETAFQTIYQIDLGGNHPELALKMMLEQETLSKTDVAFCTRLVRGVMGHLEEIDQAIQQSTEGWTIDRMMSVNRNILRLAVYEMMFCDDIPNKVALNEAIELAKVFGDDDSRSFVNRILDKILNKIKNEEASV